MTRLTAEDVSLLRRVRSKELERVQREHSGVYTAEDRDEEIFKPVRARAIDWRWTMNHDDLECVRCEDPAMHLVTISEDLVGGVIKKHWLCPHCGDRAVGTYRIPVIQELP